MPNFSWATHPLFLRNWKAADKNCSLVIDPPRKGCDEDFLKQTLAFRPERIIYVSCEPATQARDVGKLLEGGYRLLYCKPFDLFPQTRHVEKRRHPGTQLTDRSASQAKEANFFRKDDGPWRIQAANPRIRVTRRQDAIFRRRRLRKFFFVQGRKNRQVHRALNQYPRPCPFHGCSGNFLTSVFGHEVPRYGLAKTIARYSFCLSSGQGFREA